MRIALFGGRFDPPHKGHLAIARETLKTLPEIDKVFFVPDNTHPFDWKPMIVPVEDRIAMLKLIEEQNIYVSDLGMKRGGRTFAIDTIKYLHKTTKNTYVWICGSDQIKDFSKWKNFKELEELISFIVFPRKGYEHVEYLPKNFNMLYPKNYQITDISSTIVRKKIKSGESVTEIVPEKIIQYIKQKGFYI